MLSIRSTCVCGSPMLSLTAALRSPVNSSGGGRGIDSRPNEVGCERSHGED